MIKLFLINQKKNNKKDLFILNEYTSCLIKSGSSFNNKDLFKIKNTNIEGQVFEKKIRNLYNSLLYSCYNFILDVYYVVNCKKEGKYLIYKFADKVYQVEKLEDHIDNLGIIRKGIIKNNCNYKDDQLNGIYIEFNFDGEKSYECNYKNGVKDKKSIKYY
jgi:hypothetical protein